MFAILHIALQSIVFYSTGINHYELNSKHDTCHAEVDAIINLPINKGKRPIEVDVFSSRTNPKGNRLMMGKSCPNCIAYIKKELPRKGYKLNKIYYTDENGEIDHI